MAEVFEVERDRGARGVAVVTDGYWAAKQGRDALKPEWNLDGLERVGCAQQSSRHQQLSLMARREWLVGLAIALFAGAVRADDAIHKASYRGDLAQVRSLLKRGVDPDARDSSGGTALHAAMFQDNTEVVELLIAHGFDVNAIGPRNGYTPLHDAVWANNVPAARLLLARGARTDIKGRDGLTPHGKALREGKAEIAELLRSPQR